MLVLAALLACTAAYGSEWSVDGTISSDKSTDISEEGGVTTETLTKTLNVNFTSDLMPELTFEWKFSIDVTDSLSEEDYDTQDTSPKMDATLKGKWWSMAASWSQAIATTEDPEGEQTVDTTYSYELKIEPVYDDLPDATFKFEGDDDTITRAYDGNFEYEVFKLFKFKAQGQKQDTENRDPTSDDSEDRNLTASLSFDHEVLTGTKLTASWDYDRAQTLSLDRYDNIIDETDDMTNKFSGKVTTKFLDNADLSFGRDISWAKNLQEKKPPERAETTTTEFKYSPKLTKTITGELGYTDERGKNTGTDAPERTWNQSYNLSMDFSPMKSLKFTSSYDRSDTATYPLSSGETQSLGRDDAFKVDVEAKLFQDNITFKASRSISVTWQDGEKTALTRDWDISSDIGWDKIPQLEVKPSIQYTRTSDEIEATDEGTHTIKCDLTYAVKLGSVVAIDLSHSYSRISTYPEDEARFLERSDDTTLKLALNDFLRGMKIDSEYTRSATDKSGDDVGPEFTFKNSMKYDWEFISNYTFSFAYEHNYGPDADDSESFNTNLSGTFLDGMVEVKLEHELTNALEGEESMTYRYLVELSGKF